MYSLDWPRANGTPKARVRFKLSPEDFQVNEFFANPFSGEGEHVVIKIEKRGVTTEEVIKSLARIINKPIKIISYAGLKDRQAVATQWLSIHLPGEHLAGVESLEGSGWRVLEHTRHNKKIRPGFLAGNQFVITLRDIEHQEDLVARIEHVKTAGVPNYFGEQRFGREGANLVRAEELLVKGIRVKDRFLKGIYYSAARSWIFNQVLAGRVDASTWNVPLPGDVMQLTGSNSIFVTSEVDDGLLARVHQHDVSPASPLPGRRKKTMIIDGIQGMNKVYEQWQPWILGLEREGLEEAWRANILHPEQMNYSFDDHTAQLSFVLPAGAYATVVLRELTIY